MKKELIAANLEELLHQLDQATQWLEHSYQLCKKIDQSAYSEYSMDDFDKLEALTSRFARTVDILVQKIYRGIDLYEMETPGTLIDTVNRAHKRGLIDTVDDIRNIKDMRNDIAHEYTHKNLIDLFNEVVELTPLLLRYVDNARQYCTKLLT